MALLAILQLLEQHSGLQHITTVQLLDFIRLTSLLKRDIELAQPATRSSMEAEVAPDCLPQSISLFLSNAIGLSVGDLVDLWAVFKTEIWPLESEAERTSLEETTFRKHGWHMGISTRI